MPKLRYPQIHLALFTVVNYRYVCSFRISRFQKYYNYHYTSTHVVSDNRVSTTNVDKKIVNVKVELQEEIPKADKKHAKNEGHTKSVPQTPKSRDAPTSASATFSDGYVRL